MLQYFVTDCREVFVEFAGFVEFVGSVCRVCRVHVIIVIGRVFCFKNHKNYNSLLKLSFSHLGLKFF